MVIAVYKVKPRRLRSLRFLKDDENGEKERKSTMMALILYHLGALQYNTLFLRSCLLEQGS